MTTNLAKWILSADDKTKDAFASVSKNIKQTEVDFVGFAKRTAGVLGIAFGMREVIASISTIDRLKASLTTVTGSADLAADEFKRLKQFVKETPFGIDEVVSGFIKMSALGLNPTIEDMRAFGNVSAAMGKSFDQFVEAIADAATLEFERLKEFGIKTKQQAETVEFTFAGVTTRVGKDAQSITGYLKGIGETQFAGAMALQSATLGGAFTQLGNKGLELAEALGEAGLTSVIKGLANATGYLADKTIEYTKAWGEINEGAKIGPRVEYLEKQREGMNRLLSELKNLKAEYANTGSETGRSALAQQIEQKEKELNKLNELMLRNKKIVEALSAQRVKRQEADKPSSPSDPVEKPASVPKQSAALKKFIDDLKTDQAVVKEFTDRVTLLNQEFNAGRLSAERYADEVTKVSGDVQKLGEQTIDLKFDADVKIAREFSDRVAVLNQEFNAGRVSVERYAEEVTKISSEVQKLGQQTITPKFLSDEQLVKSFTTQMTALSAEFNAGAFGAERYSNEIQKILPQIAGVVTQEKEVNAERERAKQIIEGLRTPMEAYSADIIEIDALWRANAFTIEQYYAAVAARSKQYVDEEKKKTNEWASTWESAFNRFAGGVGDAVSEAIFEQEKFSDVMKGVVKGVLKQVVSGLVEIGVKKLALAAIEKFSLASHSAVSTTAAVATASSWAPAAAAVSLATLGGNAIPASAGIASTFALTEALALAGIAHGGLDAVPHDGTYLLERGERVVKKEDNQDLAKFMKGRGSNVININTTINAKGSGAANDIRALIPLIESTSVAAVQRAMAERGRRGPYG